MSCLGDVADVGQLKCAAVLFDVSRCRICGYRREPEPNLGLFFGRQRGGQGGAGQPLRLLVACRPIEQHDRFCHEWPTSRVSGAYSSNARLLKSDAALGSHRPPTVRLGAGRRSRPDAHLSASRQLGGHLGRGRPHLEHDRRRLALHRPAQRLGQRLPGGLAQQIVAKPQLLTVVDEQIRAHRLC